MYLSSRMTDFIVRTRKRVRRRVACQRSDARLEDPLRRVNLDPDSERLTLPTPLGLWGERKRKKNCEIHWSDVCE